MMNRRAMLLVFAAVLGLASGAAALQGPAPVLYRLDKGSSFSRGCYPPCLCPLYSTDDIRGTYTLTLDHSDPQFTVYRVENVNWTVTLDGGDKRITGSGTYRRGGQVALQQQMTLNLVVDGAAQQTFDSGLVSGADAFPKINVTISVSGMVCFDTVIGVASSPVPVSELRTYGLHDSTYQEGCLPPCDCPIQSWPIAGSFVLVPLPNATTPVRREWAVVNVNWATLSSTPPPARRFNGFGSYKIVDVGPSSNQRMVLDLKELNSGTQTRFDSGTVSGGTQFPNIDIDLAANGFYCNDKVFFLHASPL